MRAMKERDLQGSHRDNLADEREDAVDRDLARFFEERPRPAPSAESTCVILRAAARRAEAAPSRGAAGVSQENANAGRVPSLSERGGRVFRRRWFQAAAAAAFIVAAIGLWCLTFTGKSAARPGGPVDEAYLSQVDAMLLDSMLRLTTAGAGIGERQGAGGGSLLDRLILETRARCRQLHDTTREDEARESVREKLRRESLPPNSSGPSQATPHQPERT
ncbi:MAG TPA: hypothetical protein VM492_01190 [Sumerlaeia bacterium]|nr:hypothetical protein [Sumerlaeia bacterium]